MKTPPRVETEKEILIYYEGEEVGKHRLDILVESKVIVELKTVEELSKAHYAQVRSYLKATGVKVAILVNFAKEKADFRRVELE
ncbi:MAG: GxxExxY protein [bacterium]